MKLLQDFKKRRMALLVLFTLMLAAAPVLHQVAAQAPIRVLLVGDSRYDEFRAEDNRNACPPSLPSCRGYNWIEQIMADSSRPNRRAFIDFGTWGYWGDLRRTGYEYNLSRTGTAYAITWDAANIIVNQVPTKAANYLSTGQFSIAIVEVGSNDFAAYFSRGYAEVYNGTVSPATKANRIISNATTLFAAMRNADPDIPIVVHEISAFIATQSAIYSGFSDPAKRALVTDAINRVNDWLRTHPYGIQLVSYDTFFQYPDLATDANYIWHFGGYNINMASAGNDPRVNGTVDGLHMSVLVNCKLANWTMRIMNNTLGMGIPEFSDNECLQQAGLAPLVATPTNTPPATFTPTNIPTNTPPATDTPTNTPPATFTPTYTPTNTPAATATLQPAIMVWHVDGVDTYSFTATWQTSAPIDCSGYANYAAIFEPDGGGSYLPVRFVACWN